MMKSRLAASASLFFGEWRRNIAKSSSFNGSYPNLSKLCHQGLESLGRTVHTSPTEDDFSDLGPPVGQLKLVTEKREHFVKTDSAAKGSGSRSLPSQSRPSIKDSIPNLDKSSQASSSTLQDHNDASVLAANQKSLYSTTSVNQKSSQPMEISCSVSIENIPSTIDLPDLVQAISVFGKVSSACIRSVPDGLDCCHVDFENSESSKRAVLAGVIAVKSIHLPIHPLHSSEAVSIRIQGIGKGTSDLTIHSICKSIGALEGLAKAGKDAIDAYFRVKNDTDLLRIVTRLNNTIVDNHCWSAYQLSSNSAPRMMSEKEDAKSKLGLQMNDRFVEMKRLVNSKKMYYEDLQRLHLSILHLEGLPTTNSS